MMQALQEKGEIPDAGATKKRKAEDEEAAASQVCNTMLPGIAGPPSLENA